MRQICRQRGATSFSLGHGANFAGWWQGAGAQSITPVAATPRRNRYFSTTHKSCAVRASGMILSSAKSRTRKSGGGDRQSVFLFPAYAGGAAVQHYGRGKPSGFQEKRLAACVSVTMAAASC